MKKNSIFIIIFLFLCSVLNYGKYHPSVKWKEISNSKFIVIFQEGYEELGISTLRLSEEIFTKSKKIWKNNIRGRIRIVLNDSTDSSNGYATFYPFNTICINCINPPPDSTIGSYEEWIRTVLSHEMTHIFNYNAGSGFFRFFRKFFGSAPILYSTIAMPVWVLEGMAVYGESVLNQWGRNNTPDFDIMLDNIAKESQLAGWSKITSENFTKWPGPGASYLYGAKFIQYLSHQYGSDKISEFIRIFASYPIGFITYPRVLKKIYGKSIDELWQEFSNVYADEKNVSNGAIEQLTYTGVYKKYPVFISNKRVVFVKETFNSYPGLYYLDIKNKKEVKITDKFGINSLFYDKKSDKLFFSALSFYKSYFYFSDIFEYSFRSGTVRRITKGSRLFSPLPAESNTLYAIQRRGTLSYIIKYNKNTRKILTLSRGFPAIYGLSLSPDTKNLLCSVKETNLNWSIALFNTEKKKIIKLNRGKEKCYMAKWKNNNEFYYIRERGKSYKLALCNIKKGISEIYYEKNTPSIKYFALSEDRQQIAVSYFNHKGFDLGIIKPEKLNVIKIKTVSTEFKKQLPKPESNIKTEIKKYNSFRDFLPKNIMPNYRRGGDENQFGIFSSGSDAVKKHAYDFQSFYGHKSKQVSSDLAYFFRGLYPDLVIHFKDSHKYHRNQNTEYTNNNRQFDAALLWPLKIKWKDQVYLYTGLTLSKYKYYYSREDQYFLKTTTGLKLALIYNSAKRFYDSISSSDGFSVVASFLRDEKKLGSDHSINTFSFEYKQYLSVFRPNVLALRAGFTHSWGDGGRIFTMGGSESEKYYHLAGDNMFNLMRGYPSEYFWGTGGFIVNCEYRLSVKRLNAYLWNNVSVDHLFFTLFTDIGNLWIDKIAIKPAFSFGGELSVITSVSGTNITLSLGAALSANPSRKGVIYFRIDQPF